MFGADPLHLSVRVNEAARPAELARRDNDLSEYRIALPPEAAGWKQMEVTLSSAGAPRFGFAEVRCGGLSPFPLLKPSFGCPACLSLGLSFEDFYPGVGRLSGAHKAVYGRVK